MSLKEHSEKNSFKNKRTKNKNNNSSTNVISFGKFYLSYHGDGSRGNPCILEGHELMSIIF